ncbi:MAG: carbon-nitrogen hydrolase family protein [Hyphomonas sp.]|nr:carbon-nitrogen hydrolase family protein [Hyphomonas sp.]
MSLLGLAAIQTAAEADGNFDLVEREIRSVAKRFPWVSMVALGELAIHGSSIDLAEPAGGPTEQRLSELAKETGLWIIPGSLYETRDGKVFNTTPIFDSSGGVVARYDKLFPFLPYEKNVTPGSDYIVFEAPGGAKVGVVICYDIWFPEVIRTLCALGAEVILVPTMTNTIDRDVELAIARANAAISQCYVVAINVAGEQGVGRSVVYGPGGECIHEAGAGREILALELDMQQVRNARERGWNGLGQVLKSFRDMPATFPMHESAAARQKAMKNLGALEMPGRIEQGHQSTDVSTEPKPKLTIINKTGPA